MIGTLVFRTRPGRLARAIAVALGGVAATVALPTAPLLAQNAADPADAADIADALMLDDLIAIMHAEGVAYGETIARDLLGDAAPAGWAGRVGAIYAVEPMRRDVAAAFAGALEGDDVAAMLAFLADGPGARAVEMEVSARRARLDPAVEQSADDAAVLAVADADPRIDLIARYIAANDLIERNVADAMTSNYAFYLGLMQGGAMPPGTSESDLLADVWGQEALIRQNLTDWHYSFLYMAFAPLDDAEIESYIAFSATPAGQQLNDALFVAFDAVFTDISRDLGRAAAEFLVTQDL